MGGGGPVWGNREEGNWLVASLGMMWGMGAVNQEFKVLYNVHKGIVLVYNIIKQY